MDRKQLLNQLNVVVIDLDRRPGKFIWDGVFHGENDPNGPIGGGGRTLGVSNGF